MSPAARRLLAFALLAAFVSVFWVGMVVDPPLGRAALSVLPVAVVVALLLPLRRSRLPGWAVNLLGAVSLLAAAGLAMVVVGLPLRLLAPGGWSQLWSGIDLGLAGLGDGVDYPYAGSSEWSRLLILIGGPAIVGLAALVSFLPLRRDPAAPRTAGLAVLVIGFATAATNRGSDHAVLLGVALLLGVVAWVWLPVVERRALLGGAALVAVAIAVAIPFTVSVRDGSPLVSYSNWSWASGPGTAFSWEHSYGPIDWERTEDTMLFVESDQPNYWKASVLDRFDGRNWERSDLVQPSVELPSDVESAIVPADLQADWFTEVSVSISGFRSDLAVGPGSGRSVTGIDATRSSDGSLVRTLVEPLSKGDAYDARGYAPDPTVSQMRAAGWSVPRALAPMTEIDLPQEAGSPNERVRTLGLPQGRAAAARRAIGASPYRRMAQLAERVSAGSTSAYDAVKAIEEYLLENYRYSETPPERPLPLESFLFEDRIGYCQQFSGAMAVMLRMLGIPARVATGFSAGIPEGGDRFRVRALDAHSWVEVYFARIGWVPFDPTPAAAPAQLRTGGTSAASSAASSLGPLLYGARGFFGDGDGVGPGRRGRGAGRPPPAPSAGSSPGSIVSGLWLSVMLLGAGAAAVAPGVWRRLRERRADPEELVEARVRELERALRRLRYRHQPDATLLDVERALRSRAEPLAARYVERLRRLRYEPAARDRLPNGAERRALRRRLSGRGGLAARIAAYRTMPPLSPRR